MAEGHTEIPTWAPPAPVVATPQQIDQVAQILASAANPIIITEHSGRTDTERAALVGIAEALCAPVFEFWNPAYHNFPRSHPLYGAGPVEAVLGEADAILLAGCNGPWQPTPDYVKQAEAYGGTGERVQKVSELRPALQHALEVVGSGRTFMLDVIVDP